MANPKAIVRIDFEEIHLFVIRLARQIVQLGVYDISSFLLLMLRTSVIPDPSPNRGKESSPPSSREGQGESNLFYLFARLLVPTYTIHYFLCTPIIILLFDRLCRNQFAPHSNCRLPCLDPLTDAGLSRIYASGRCIK